MTNKKGVNMIWIILIFVIIVLAILGQVFCWGLWDDMFCPIMWIFSVIMFFIVFCYMFTYIDAKNQFMINAKNIELKREMLKNIEADYYKLNQSGKFVNIENNNYMQEKLKIQQDLLKDIIKYNSNLAFAKFRANNKLLFIGFNKNYDEFDYLK